MVQWLEVCKERAHDTNRARRGVSYSVGAQSGKPGKHKVLIGATGELNAPQLLKRSGIQRHKSPAMWLRLCNPAGLVSERLLTR